jgi:hypothetical protein
MENPCNKDYMELFYAFTSVTIGNGTKASFWEDSWADGISPKVMAPSIFAISQQKSWSVYKATNNDVWSVNLIYRRVFPSNNCNNSPSYGSTLPALPYVMPFRTPFLGNLLIAEFTLAPQLIWGNLRAPSSHAWIMWCGKFGHLQNARYFHGS